MSEPDLSVFSPEQRGSYWLLLGHCLYARTVPKASCCSYCCAAAELLRLATLVRQHEADRRALVTALKEMARRERNYPKLLEAAERYVASHRLMRVRFQDAADSEEYVAASKALDALLAAPIEEQPK